MYSVPPSNSKKKTEEAPRASSASSAKDLMKSKIKGHGEAGKNPGASSSGAADTKPVFSFRTAVGTMTPPGAF